MRKITTLLLLILVSVLEVNSQTPKLTALNETFETDSPTRDLWSFDGTKWNIYISDYAAYQGSRYLFNSTQETDTVFGPKILVTAGDELRFWARYMAPQGGPRGQLKVIYSSDKVNWTTILDVSNRISFSYVNYYVSLNNYLGEGYIAFVGYNWVAVDNITVPQIIEPQQDVKVTALVVPENMRVGESSVFKVRVKNIGQNTANSFNVNIKDGNTVLASALAENIIAGDTAWLEIPYIPTAGGRFNVHAAVDYSLDEISFNNTTAEKGILVLEQGESFFYIKNPKTGGARGDVPIIMNKKTSVFEAIYLNEFFPVGGFVNKLELNVQACSENLDSIPVRVWMGELPVDSLNSGWVTTDKLDLLYDSIIQFHAGTYYPVTIDLTKIKQFHYSKTSNIVLFIEKVFSDAHELIYFLADFYDDDRRSARFYYNNLTSLNTTDLTTQGNSLLQWPDISFYVSTNNTGWLTGVGKNTEGMVLANAEISFVGNNVKTFTDASGAFVVPSLPIGVYSLVVKDSSYHSVTSEIEITDQTETHVEIALEKLPIVNVSGKTINKSTGLAIANAVVSLTNDYVFTDTTDANGNFEFSQIFGGIDYQISIAHPEYNQLIDSISIENVDVDLGNWELESFLFPARNLTVQIINADSVALNWDKPLPGLTVFDNYQIFVVTDTNSFVSEWTLNQANYYDTAYVDAQWSDLPQGQYYYAVIAVYQNGNSSKPVFSQGLTKNRFANVILTLSGTYDAIPVNATVTLTNNAYPDSIYTAISNDLGIAVFDSVWHGYYNLKASCLGFEPFEQVSATVYADTTHLDALLDYIPFPAPANLSAIVDLKNVYLTWEAPLSRVPDSYTILRNDSVYAEMVPLNAFTDSNLMYGKYSYTVYAVFNNGSSITTDTVKVSVLELMPPTEFHGTSKDYDVSLTWVEPGLDVAFYDGFENHEDFSIDFKPWTLLDLDGAYTFYNGQNFPNNITPKSFFIYNNSKVNPDHPTYKAYKGDKCALSFNAYQKDTRDWMITPPIYIGSDYKVSFMAKNHINYYSLAHFTVWVGTDPNPENMIRISGEGEIPPGGEWQEYTFDLSQFAGKICYIGIFRYDFEVTSFLLIDEFKVYQASRAKNNGTLGYNLYRDGKKINQNPLAYTSYTDKVNAIGTYSYELTAAYASGESDTLGPIEVTVKVPEISVDKSVLAIDIDNSSETATLPLNITNTGNADLEYQLSVRYDIWNLKNSSKLSEDETESLSDNTQNQIVEPVMKSQNTEDVVLWDNSDIFVGSGGIISMEFGGTTLTNGADDFYVEPGVSWEINRISAQGYTTTDMLDPDRLGVIVYGDNNGLPGDELFREYTDSVYAYNQEFILENPIILKGGRYWISVFGSYDNEVGIKNGRWNWSTGTKLIDNCAVLQDKAGLYNLGQGFDFQSLQSLDLSSCSFSFKLEGISSGLAYNWMSFNNGLQTLSAAESRQEEVEFNAAGLSQGAYSAYIYINSNSLTKNQIVIPCQLNYSTDISSKKSGNISLYPVPAKDQLFIEGNNIQRYEIYDVSGRPVSQSNFIENTPISLNNIPGGSYVIKIYTANGNIEVRQFSIIK